MNTSDYLLAAGAPEAVAVIDARGRHTYADLRGAAGKLAAALAELDLPAGARVGILAPNSLFWVAGYLAVLKLGYVAVPFSDKQTVDGIRPQARLAGCSAVLSDRRTARRFGDVFGPDVPVLTEVELAGDRAPYWPDADADATGAGGVTEPGDDAALMFTSGTTAAPKAVRVTHRNIQANTDAIVDYLGLRDDDRMLVVLPFFYVFGASLLHTHLRVGGSVAVCNTFTFPQTALDMIEKESCTGFAGVPSSYLLLLRIGGFADHRLPSLRHLQQAGGKLADTVITEIAAAQPQARLFVMYGQTEATARLSYLPPDRLGDKRGSIGRGIPGVQLRVLDEQGEPVPVGQRGEIYALGDNISPGYLDDPEASAEKFTPRGMRTGDIAVVDEEGFIFIVDRRADFIKSWGNRVSSGEVEGCALQLADLSSAAAVGAPHPEAGEAIVLYATVHPDSALTPDGVLDHMRRSLPTYMVPQRVVFLDAMPLSGNGKIVKSALRERAAADTDREGTSGHGQPSHAPS
ncbi:MAG: AMP-binding protein [Kineosporiaceae bacterium]